jgi:hypothetical protein
VALPLHVAINLQSEIQAKLSADRTGDEPRITSLKLRSAGTAEWTFGFHSHCMYAKTGLQRESSRLSFLLHKCAPARGHGAPAGSFASSSVSYHSVFDEFALPLLSRSNQS